jgi:type III secretory pathway component EscS
MGKTNWARVLIGGLIAGVVLNWLSFAAWWFFIRPTLIATLQALGRPAQETVGAAVLMVVLFFLVGILATWLYAAIRPRYGAGPGTAVLAGLAAGLMLGVFPDIGWGMTLRLIPGKVWAADAVMSLVVIIVATVLGAWVYQEQES